MTDPKLATDDTPAQDISFEAFRDGLPHGRFRVIVNPSLAQRFVAERLHATPVAIALIGPGIASALAGYPVAGGLLVAFGLLLRRAVKWQAPKIALHLASRQPHAYHQATENGVMEVRRI